MRRRTHLQTSCTARLVHVVDDDQEILDSISFLLRAEGIETTTHLCAGDFLDRLGELRPGCILLDIHMPGMSGLELQEHLSASGCRMPVVIVTGHGDVSTAVTAMKHGAIDFIQKPFSKEDLLAAVQEAWTALDRSTPDEEECRKARELASKLTPRELQVLKGLVKGQQNKIIAHELGISPRTVELYRANAMRRLSARSLSEMLHIAFLADVGTA